MRAPKAEGQASVEFALVSVVLVLLLAGAIEFGQLYSAKLDLEGAARAGARWAAANPTAWSNAASPASNTIEGQVLGAGGSAASVPNDSSHLLVEYFAFSGGTTVACGSYQQGTNTFVAANGYTQSTCVTAGSLVRVTATLTPATLGGTFGGLFGGIAVTGRATMPVL